MSKSIKIKVKKEKDSPERGNILKKIYKTVKIKKEEDIPNRINTLQKFYKNEKKLLPPSDE